MGRKACLLGATGLIGSHLMELLLADSYFSELHVLVRKPLDRQDPRLTVHVIDFQDPKQYEAAIQGAETVFCAIGTTLKQVKGDREAYRRVDYDIPLNAAKAAAKFGVFGFMLVSSIGADAANNNNFYLKLKGIVEEAVSKQQIPQVHIFRPSLLLGDRKEKRGAEGIAQALAPIVSPLMMGKWRTYKPIQASMVAEAMLGAAKTPARGIFIHTYDGIKTFIRDPHQG